MDVMRSNRRLQLAEKFAGEEKYRQEAVELFEADGGL